MENDKMKVKHNPDKIPAKMTDAYVNRVGGRKYKQKFAPIVNTKENQGKFFVLDIETDEYEIGEDLSAMTEHAVARNPNTKFYLRRIGYNSIFSFI